MYAGYRVWAIVTVTALAGCTHSPANWTQGDGFRYRELNVQGRSRTGFTEVDSQRSGITAVNAVSQDAIIANRHMMHGSGIAIGDVTGDGLPDVYVARLSAPDALYQNLGDWRFENISVRAGLDSTVRATAGVVMADLDGDNDLDLLLTMPLGPGAVYRNLGGGRFELVPNASGLNSSYASTTAALADVDNDGDLDAYIARYKRIALADSLPPAAISWEAVLSEGGQVPKEEFKAHYRFTQVGTKVIRSELAEPDGLYLNDGSGHFARVSWTDGAFLDTAGKPITSAPKDWALTAKFYDVTGDGIADLYVCNDFDSPDALWIGLGNGVFRHAPNHALRKTSNATMSVDFSDVNRDGIVDFFMTDMLSRDYSRRLRQRNTRIPLEGPPGDLSFRPQEMQNALMVGRGDTTFAELAWFAQVAASDWSWATSFMDVDLDGWEDILITTGHVYDVQDLDAQGIEQRRMASAPSWQAARRLLLYFPPLALENVAFRNRGDLTFEDMPGGWGLGQSADVAHGMALGDLDGDGDLDIVTNRLNASPGVYRNTGKANRLAVMLEGEPPNTGGVGADIRVHCMGLPEQSKQMTLGGAYLSSNQLIAVFAMGSAPCRVEVTWPSGKHSSVDVDAGNRLYVIEESGATHPTEVSPDSPVAPMYTLHSQSEPRPEQEFDDFQLQPLLPWRLSRRGPALAALDVDGDGRSELLEGAGQNQTFRLQGRPILDPLSGDATGMIALPVSNGRIRMMVGESGYERLPDSSWVHIYDIAPDGKELQHQRIPFGRGVPGPLSVADIDLDGDLDLFVGGHFIPGAYPRAANSHIYLNEQGAYRLGESLSGLGPVSGSVFGDMNGDGREDLVLATEWGPVRVLISGEEGFSDQTESLGLQPFQGLWRGASIGDFDGDHRLDIVASNAGWNSRYDRGTKVRVHYGDFDANGTTDILESFLDPVMNSYRPSRMLADLISAIPPMQMRVTSHQDFSTMEVAQLMPSSAMENAQIVEADTYASSIFLNRGDHFEHRSLPAEAQYSAGISPVVLDANLDGYEDIILSQNWFAYPLSTPRQDAGRGLLLLGHGDGTFTPESQSGFEVYGEGRAVSVGDFDGDGQDEVAFSQHNGATLVYRQVSYKEGISIEFASATDAIGAILCVIYSDGSRGPARLVTGGTGYWSQNATTATLGLSGTPVGVEVTWPGGQRPVTVKLEGDSRVLLTKQ